MRKSNFELFRLVLMFFIIMHHFIVHGLGLSSLDPMFTRPLIIRDSDMLLMMSLNSMFIIAVNCFIIVSGYFSIKVNGSKILRLLIECLFYTVLFTTIPLAIEGNYRSALSSLLIISHSKYWFFVDYLFLIVLAPALNIAYEHMSQKQSTIFTFGLLIISVYFGWFWGHDSNYSGYTLFQFIFMYCLGRFIRINDINVKSSICIVLYVIASILTAVIMYFMWSKGMFKMAWKMTYYNQPLIVFSSVIFFLIFKNLNFTNSNVNKLAQSALAIYFVSSSKLVGGYINNFVGEFYAANGNVVISIVLMTVISVLVIFFSIAIDQTQAILNNKIVKSANSILKLN